MPFRYVNGHNRSNLILKWSARNKPVISVRSGDTVTMDVPDSSTDQVSLGSPYSAVSVKDPSYTDAAVGPVFVEDAKKGDILKVEILDIWCGNWGWSMHTPDFGLLADMFGEPAMYYWTIQGGFARPYRNSFLKGISLRIKPFMGVMGVAPPEGEEYALIPPQFFGGNMDNRMLRQGSTVYFPVHTEGALFAASDTHALQGDGEVCGTAIETSSKIRLRLSVVRERSALKAPFVVSRGIVEERKLYSTSGISSDLYTASRLAVIQMIDLMEEAGLSRSEAYVLCSIAGSLSIREIVDRPNWNVSFSIESSILEKIGITL
ncbi:MAG: acetamidase/formamidase family protein [Thermoplasmata archaeon]|uniref:Acetamidase/formamidase family protein n=1 Tax=Candidatus Sysuiplasma superficiale TaxID=2823368 RepID=A0A8J8CI12_9ARCH|nr:acetamidase/formamidase family protein [Candidatus Sysuiplasma superficiale]